MQTFLRKRTLAVGAAFSAVLALGLAAPAGAYAASSTRAVQAAQAQATVTVPDVVGDYVDVAFYSLQAAGLNTTFVQYKDYVCDYTQYTIVRQSPTAGSSVAAGTYVRISFAVRPAPPAVCP
ncbi:PASTA domain-containing protein [Krasilnikovia sp. M28-CT-15]|uniref:PASTA domain-containing protein n=1 Tax=Krasilnikovia sp. M28-CT-15 TaxID=3373540 RepID=UPI00399D2471